MPIYVSSGDVTKTVDVDAISTLINLEGDWFGGVDFAIRRVAGDQYHKQVEQVLEKQGLVDGQVVVARGNRHHNQEGSFNNVIFVCDDLKQPLRNLVYVALQKARELGYKSIALPLMRTGVMLGKVEPDAHTVVVEMQKAFQKFFAETGSSELDVFVIVYKDTEALTYLRENLNKN